MTGQTRQRILNGSTTAGVALIAAALICRLAGVGSGSVVFNVLLLCALGFLSVAMWLIPPIWRRSP